MPTTNMITAKLNPVDSLAETLTGESEWKASYVLFENVKNMSEVREKLVQGEMKAALINPHLIIDLFQVTVAVNRAVRSFINEKMVTKTIFTEIIYNLSPDRKIANALQNFGINAKMNSLLAVLVSNEEDIENSNIFSIIDGNVSSLERLSSMRDEPTVQKIYKLNNEEMKNVLFSILGKMACKSFI